MFQCEEPAATLHQEAGPTHAMSGATVAFRSLPGVPCPSYARRGSFYMVMSTLGLVVMLSSCTDKQVYVPAGGWLLPYAHRGGCQLASAAVRPAGQALSSCYQESVMGTLVPAAILRALRPVVPNPTAPTMNLKHFEMIQSWELCTVSMARISQELAYAKLKLLASCLLSVK